MSRKCLTCGHRDVNEINQLIQANTPYLEISRRFGVSKDSVRNHAKNHLRPIVVRANAIAERRFVNEIVELREVVNYEPIKKVKYAQDFILSELENAQEQSERTALIRELRGWVTEENKILGNYTKDRENPESLTDESLAKELCRRLRARDFNEDEVIEGVRSKFPNVDIRLITKTVG